MNPKPGDKTALVTGSTDGIGEAVANSRARKGIDVVRLRRWAVGAPVFVVALAVIAAFNVDTTRPVVVTAADGGRFSDYVDQQGNISLPADYQTRFLHLGTFSVATKAGGPTDELHGVYARSEDVAAFQRDGRFPDGAVIVKDVYQTRSEGLITGNASWATDLKLWFVMIKDSQGRFKGNDLWGDGWGWALFEARDPKKQIATDYRTDCRTCHVPARKDDWVYVRGYPVLHSSSKR